MSETVRAGREVPYAWRRRRRGLPRGLLRTDSPSACSRTTTVRPKKRACVEETTPPKTERASPVVFCSTLRCEARFSIGRIARKPRRETPLQRGLHRIKTRLKIQAWLWLAFARPAVQQRSLLLQPERIETLPSHATPCRRLSRWPRRAQNTQSLRCQSLRLAYRCRY